MLLPERNPAFITNHEDKERNISPFSKPRNQDADVSMGREQIQQLKQRHEFERRLLGLFIDHVKQTGRCDYPDFVRFMASAYEQSKDPGANSFFLNNLVIHLSELTKSHRIANQYLLNQ